MKNTNLITFCMIACLFLLQSCKNDSNKIVIEENYIPELNNKYSSFESKEILNKTKDFFQLDFDLSQNLISIDNGIDSITSLRIQSEKLISFQTTPFSRIVESNDLYFAVPYEINRLLVIDKKGEILTTIKASVPNIESPYQIGFFDVDSKNKLIYILDELKAKVFVYSYDGRLMNSFQIPDLVNMYYKLFVIDKNTLVLQTKGQPSDEVGSRDSSMVGSTLDLKTMKILPMYIQGGGFTRDLLLGNGFFQSNTSLYFNYNMSSVLYENYNKKLWAKCQITSSDFVTEKEIFEFDLVPRSENTKIRDNFNKNRKIWLVRGWTIINDIHFIQLDQGDAPHWLFYNEILNKFKVMKLNFGKIESALGKPLPHIIRNVVDNALMVFIDGDALQDNKEFKEKYDPNSTYLLKIYPKYLNQSAWE